MYSPGTSGIEKPVCISVVAVVVGQSIFAVTCGYVKQEAMEKEERSRTDESKQAPLANAL